MDINLKNQLKKFRLAKGCTQEQLAANLGISPQAVGKWERGEGYPDITLLPAIALFFGITVDELLDVGKERINEKITTYEKESTKLIQSADFTKNYELWKKAYTEFLEEYRVQKGYIDAIWRHTEMRIIVFTDGKPQPWDEERQEKGKEILSIGNHLLSTCTDRTIVDPVINILCLTAKCMGDNELAKQYAENLGSLYFTREDKLSWILESDEAVKQLQENLISLLNMLTSTINRQRIVAQNLSDGEALTRLNIALWDLVLGKNEHGIYHYRVYLEYHQLAVFLALQNQSDNALSALEKMADHIIRFDQSGSETYNVPWLRGRTFAEDTYMKPDTYKKVKVNRDSEILYAIDHKLQSKVFDGLRDNPRFIALVDRLKYAVKQ